MMARDARQDPPTPPESVSSVGGTGLSDEERRAIQTAAEADGYSETFVDLLCRFAELIGTDEVLRELERLESEEQQS